MLATVLPSHFLSSVGVHIMNLSSSPVFPLQKTEKCLCHNNFREIMCDCLNGSLNEGMYKALNVLCVECPEPADFKHILESS